MEGCAIHLVHWAPERRGIHVHLLHHIAVPDPTEDSSPDNHSDRWNQETFIETEPEPSDWTGKSA